MSEAGKPDPCAGTAAGAPAVAAWECFARSVGESLALWPRVLPIPDWEDPGDPAVRAMQRARRYTWLHARHGLNWSMFEAIRISVRLAEAFAEWTRDGAPALDVLADRLRQVEQDARQAAPMRAELRFVDHLMDAATTTELRLADMELALEALREAEKPEPARAAG